MTRTVIVAGARTPIGKLQGSLSTFSGVELGGVAIRAALERSAVDGNDVDYVYMGHVIQAGAGQITARQAAVAGGIPMAVAACTVNKVCLSGLNALFLGHQLISSGLASVVVAGGMESMSRAPHVLNGSRAGFLFGDVTLTDSMMHDGLTCAFDHCSMGEATDHHVGATDITRTRMDEFSARSHERAAAASKNGTFDAEITPVTVPQRKGDPIVVSNDEGIRADTSADSLAKLRPAFTPDGALTAGNSSQISDGACALVLMSEDEAARRGLTPLAFIAGYGMVAGPDTSLLHQPSNAIRAAAKNANVHLNDLRRIEINEAFAAVGVASMDDLGIDDSITNVNGGAIALGHPVGMSGARLALTLALELQRNGGGYGAAALCGGGGQGDAIVLQVP